MTKMKIIADIDRILLILDDLEHLVPSTEDYGQLQAMRLVLESLREKYSKEGRT